MRTPSSAPSPDASPLARVRAMTQRILIITGVFSLAVNLLMLTLPLYMLQVFDRVLASESMDTLLVLSAIALFALLVQGILDAIRSMALTVLGREVESQLSGYALSQSVISRAKFGQPGGQALRDLAALRGFLASNGLIPLLDAPWIPVFLAAVFILNPMVGWLAIAGSVILIAAAIANEYFSRGMLLKAASEEAQATRNADLSVQNADVIEAMGMLPSVVRRFHLKNTPAREAQTRAAFTNASFSGGSKAFRFALQIGVLGVGAYAALQGEMTPGAMIAASILVGRALAPVDMAIGQSRMATTALGAYRRVTAQLQTDPFANRGASGMPEPTGTLNVQDVTFLYPGQQEPILRNISFQLEPTDILGIVGPAAAGKSTLARLLTGVQAPNYGHIRLDGVEMSAWAPEERGQFMGYLPQTVELFSGSVAENIARMRIEEAWSEESVPAPVVEAARLVGAHQMILALPNGYATEIGHGGASLSGGQRQQVALARAAYGDPKFVVLDEPNSNLDQVGDAAFAHAVQTLKAHGATVVIVSHRPNIMQHADKMLVMNQGQVSMFGPREDVLPKLLNVAPQGDRSVHVMPRPGSA